MSEDFNKLPETLPQETPQETSKDEGRRLSISERRKAYHKTLGREHAGLKLGMKELDDSFRGFFGVNVLGGIPSSGKTTLALQMAFTASESTDSKGNPKKPVPVLFYSLEQTEREMMTKLYNRFSGINMFDIQDKGDKYLDEDRKLKENKLGEVDYEEYAKNNPKDYLTPEQVKKLKEVDECVGKTSNFYIIEATEKKPVSADSIEADIIQKQKEHNTTQVLVVIDNLQDFNGDAGVELKAKLDKVMSDFKDIYVRTDATFLVLSQKNRDSYGTSNQKSFMGSAGIEYKAEIGLLIETPAEQSAPANLSKDDKKKWEANISQTMFEKKEVESIILKVVKNRHARPKNIHYNFEGAVSTFKYIEKGNEVSNNHGNEAKPESIIEEDF